MFTKCDILNLFVHKLTAFVRDEICLKMKSFCMSFSEDRFMYKEGYFRFPLPYAGGIHPSVSSFKFFLSLNKLFYNTTLYSYDSMFSFFFAYISIFSGYMYIFRLTLQQMKMVRLAGSQLPAIFYRLILP
jgi:hypothetical protein